MQPVRSFQIVCALIAVHVVVADGVTLEPGTTLGDRWLGLLVPLSVLALVCIAYPRVKPGLAAAVALSLAALALVGSALAIIALDVEGFDASTVTGAAMLVGALLLAWLGFSGLWRSRKGVATHSSVAPYSALRARFWHSKSCCRSVSRS